MTDAASCGHSLLGKLEVLWTQHELAVIKVWVGSTLCQQAPHSNLGGCLADVGNVRAVVLVQLISELVNVAVTEGKGPGRGGEGG